MSTSTVTKSDLESVLEGSIPASVAIRYLGIYVGDADWEKFLGTLYTKVKSKRPADPAELMRKIISCAILLPAVERGTNVEPPESLLLKCQHYHQFEEKDWVSIFKDVVKRDIEVERWRDECLSLGIVDRLTYSPITRQALNWLMDRAEKSGCVNDASRERIKKRLQNLVFAYGGTVICNMFMNHEKEVNKVVNWRSGYFFERLIFNVYDVDQVVKIKRKELEKTNPSLVKKIRID